MTWQDELRPASFRGVPFQTRSTETSGGKRGQLHEYPQRDLPYFEELGLQGEKFSVDAYVIGAEYMRARDALISALRTRGAGTLVHPYRGSIEVVAVDWSIRETTDDGGMAVFSISFVESGTNTFPTATPRTGDLLETAADAASSASAGSFESVFSTSGSVQWVVDDAASLVRSIAESLGASPDGLGDLVGDLASYARTINLLSSDAADLAGDPSSLATRVLGAIGELAGLSGSGSSVLTVFESLSTFGSSLVPIQQSTPSRERQAANRDALVSLVRRSAAVEAARASGSITVSSYDEAVEVRDRALAVLDQELDAAGEAGDDDAYRALSSLALALVRDFRARGATLSRVAVFTPMQTIPVLLLAQQVYGGIDRVDEIVSRNGIRHPGFAPGGQPLELLVA